MHIKILSSGILLFLIMTGAPFIQISPAQAQSVGEPDVSRAVNEVFAGIHDELLKRRAEKRLWEAYSDAHFEAGQAWPVLEYGVHLNGEVKSVPKEMADAWFQLTAEAYGTAEDTRPSSNLRFWSFPALDIVLVLRLKDPDILLDIEEVVENHVPALLDFQQTILPFQLRLTSPARYYRKDSAIRLDFELINRSENGFQVRELKISTLDCRISGKPWGKHAEGEARWVTLPAGGSLRSSYVLSGFDPEDGMFQANCRYLVGYRDILPEANLRLPVR